MCGISGYISKQDNLLPNSIIFKISDLVNHRGPDDEGYIFLNKDKKIITAGGINTPVEVWKSKTEYQPVYNNKELNDQSSLMAFGHKRLSILDLTSTGHQPMSYKNGRYWIIHNGEIYNFLEIRAELKVLGHQFTSRTDTETILAAYSEWGEDCLNRFVGMWSFVLYDKDKNELFISRDRYGIKPFYYYFSPYGDFYFASEIKQFTAIPEWQSKLNPSRAYDYLVYSFTDHTDETMFSRVFQLPGGSFYKASLDNIKPDATGRIPYKKWYFLKKDPFKGSFKEATNIFRVLFERAVKEHLYADVPVGTALSGGIDSSSIVCEVNRILLSNGNEALQKTFSSCSTDERFSEKKWMDIVINHTKVDAHFVFPSLNDALKTTSDILWHHDEPYQSQSAFLAYNVFRKANNNGVKVLLNGQGADEYLGGYGQFTIARYANMLRSLRVSAMLNDIGNFQKNNQISKFSILFSIIFHLLPPLLKRRLTSIKSSSDNVKSIIDSKKLNLTPIHPFDIIPTGYRTVNEVSEHLTFFSTLPKYLHWEDRNSMAHSIEARVPLLDHRLVEFAYNLPDDFLEKDGVTKRVMREAMSGLIPDKIKNRKDKMGFTTPEELWVKKENPMFFRKKISEAINVTNGIIKPDALLYFDNVINEKYNFDYTYWRIILFSEWLQKFKIVL